MKRATSPLVGDEKKLKIEEYQVVTEGVELEQVEEPCVTEETCITDGLVVNLGEDGNVTTEELVAVLLNIKLILYLYISP